MMNHPLSHATEISKTALSRCLGVLIICFRVGVLSIAALSVLWAAPRQAGPAGNAPSLADAQHYNIEVELQPEEHRLRAGVTIDFVAVDLVQSLVFDLNRNCTVTQVFDGQNREVEHSQDDFETFTVKVSLREAVHPGESFSLRFVYDGNFEKGGGRSRGSVAEVEAVVAPEGVYLPYASKWIPTYRFLVDRATSKMAVTVPLGYTAVGPGEQLPSEVKGITEIFTSVCQQPILPGSLVAGQLFPKSLEQEGLKIDFFVDEEHLSACEKVEAALLPYFKYFREKLGPYPWGEGLNVIEVADLRDYFPGAPGVLYLPHSIFKAVRPDVSLLARKLAYQWWAHPIPVAEPEDVWLQDAMSFYAPVPFLETEKGVDAFREEVGDLEVLALQAEGKSAVLNAFRLGYMSEDYQAIAGGKGGWVMHMLRHLIGEDKFTRLLSQWYANAGQPASVSTDFRELANKAAGEDINWFFIQWVDSIGVPQFDTEYIMLKTRTGFKVSGSIKLDKDLFRMPVEIAVETKGKTERTVVVVQGKRTDFRLDVETQPVRIVVDPDNRVLRDSPELKVAVFIARGRKLSERGQLVEAIQQFEEALRLNQRKSVASFYLGETLYEQWNTQSAANAFRDALNGDLDPKWVEVWSYIYLGKIFDILGQRDRAVAEYTKAVNTKNDYNGAQAEAQKHIQQPFVRQRTVMEK